MGGSGGNAVVVVGYTRYAGGWVWPTGVAPAATGRRRGGASACGGIDAAAGGDAALLLFVLAGTCPTSSDSAPIKVSNTCETT